MSALPMSTLDVQKALTVAAAQNFHIDPPGALDGRWGPHTQASFDSWVANQPAQMITNSVLLVQPVRGAQSVTIDAAAAGVLQSLAAIYGIQSNTSQQIPSAAQGFQQQAATTAAARAAAVATSTGTTTPAQRAAASAAISQGSGQNTSNPLVPQLPGLLMQQDNGGPLGIDWWVWGLIGVATVATGGGLYWYYKHGRKHRRRR